MSEKQAPSASSDAQVPGEARGCTVIEVSPSECLDLLQRFGGVPYRDLPSDFRGLVILDVRTAQEYRSGHLNGSTNLDFRSAQFVDELAKLGRSNAFLVYCRTGVRSGRAIALMRSLGFAELYNLTGGITGWQKKGYEIVLDSNKHLL